MNRFLIALDMDGTLLNKKKKIPLLTKIYLRKLAKEGHIIVLASGRPSRALKPYYNDLRLNSPLICYNGAYLFDPNDKKFKTHVYSFPKDEVKSIIDSFKPYIENVMCETDTDIFIDKKDPYLQTFFYYEGMNIHEGEIKNILNEDPMTCIARVKDGVSKEEREKMLHQFDKYDDLSLRYWSGSPYFELFYKSATKGACVKAIAEYYDIPKKDIIVFGDADNDLEMLKVAGYGVAMLNGKESFKAKADIISLKTNEKDGIYHTLKAIFKGHFDK